MPDQTPEQREAALKLADELRSAAIDSRLDMKPIYLMMDGAKAIRDLHAENVRLREALKQISMTCGDRSNTETDLRVKIIGVCHAALSGSPDSEAETKV